MRRALLLCVAVAACKYDALPPLTGDGGTDSGGDGSLPPGSSMLAAIEPSIAPAGTTITLEGTFVDPMTVEFPGGVSATATVLGPHRATVIVPATASSGSLGVTTGGVVTNTVSFRSTPFTPKLSNFRALWEQVDAARPATTLVTPRAGATAVATGHWLYVIGGQNGGSYLNTVERALINADGTLGAFKPFAAATLSTARAGAVAAVFGNRMYVIGGTGTGGPMTSVERADIAADGTLGTFSTVSDVALATARTDATSAVVGDALLVIGGANTAGKLGSIERAVIDPDGSLHPFTTVTQSLSTGRAGAAAIAAGGTLYVIGGDTASGIKTTVESTPIAPDGTLGTFAATTGVALASARAYFSAAVLGTTLYVVGGSGASGSDLLTIESAQLTPDGVLGSFSLASGIGTTSARHSAASAIARDRWFLVGGSSDTGELASVEHGGIDNNGALAAFATLATQPLAAPRAEAGTVTIGDRLYYIGGADLTTLAYRTDVDSAVVQPDGSLGPFALASGVSVTATRLGAITAVIGDYVYLIGGMQVTGPSYYGVTTVERAPISADGTLGTFSPYPASNLVLGRGFANGLIVGDKLYVLCGIGNGAQANISLEVATIGADGELGTFSSIPTNTNRTNYQHANANVAVLGDYAYIFGGSDGSGISLRIFERAPIQNNALGRISYELDSNANQMDLSTERALASGAVVGDHLFLVAGANNVGAPSDPGLRDVDHTTILSDGSLGGWSILPNASLAEGVFYHAGATLGDFVYVLGGGSHTSTTTPTEVKQALLR